MLWPLLVGTVRVVERSVLVEVSSLLLLGLVPELLVRLVYRLALVLVLGNLIVKTDSSSLGVGELLPPFLQLGLVLSSTSHVAELLLSFLESVRVFAADSGVAELEFPLLNEFLLLLLAGQSELLHAFLLDLRLVRYTFSAS